MLGAVPVISGCNKTNEFYYIAQMLPLRIGSNILALQSILNFGMSFE